MLEELKKSLLSGNNLFYDRDSILLRYKFLLRFDMLNDPDYTRVLALTIAKPPADWLAGPYDFTVTNPYAQRAVWPFQIFRIDTIKIDGASGKMIIAGASLDSNLKVSYIVGAGASTSVVRTNDVKMRRSTRRL